MRHPRSCCTFETMAHRKKQVWQPGGGPSGATCCGALLIILSAFLSFSFRSRPSSVSLRSSSLLPLFAPLPSFSSSSKLLFSPAHRLFPSSEPCWSPSPQVAATSAQRVSSFIRTRVFYCCETMSFKCLGARDILSLSLVKGRLIKRGSTKMLQEI